MKLKYLHKARVWNRLIWFLFTLHNFNSFGQNVTYYPLHNQATFNNRAVDQNLPVGSSSGSGDVASGSAVYTFNLSVPPGTNGVAPAISVSYYSLGGNGILGQGWRIGGLSEITRTVRNNYFDNEVNPVTLTNSDRFILDGARLICKTGNYGEPNATYGTENENFATITSKSAQGDGPEWFEVLTKEGIKMEYGNSPDARHTGQNATVLTWALSRISYPDGNYIIFKYKSAPYCLLIEEINYTGNTAQALAPFNQIKFDYKIRTIDENAVFEHNTRIETRYLLDKITTKTGGVAVADYQFNYGHDNINSYLKEIVESGSDGTALNATIFKYGDTPAEFSTVKAKGYDDPSSNTITGDFNADGLTDFLAANLTLSNQPKYKLTVFTKYPQYTGSPDNFYIGNITEAPTTFSIVKKQSIPNSFDFLAYDFTGDGADDVLMTNVAGSRQNRSLTSLRIYRTIQNYNWQTNAQDAIQLDPLTISPYNGYSKIHPNGHFIFPGDYDGDGVQDILTILGTNAVHYNCHLYNGRVQPDFGSLVISGVRQFELTDWAAADKIHVVDFNGDGKSDIMIIKGIDCEIFTFDGWVARRIHFSGGYVTKDHLSYFGDFNGDRKTDILAKSTTSGAWKILISNGIYFYESPFTFNTIPDTDPYIGDQLAIADLNGDGKSDIYHGWQLAGDPTAHLDAYYGKGYSNAGAGFHRVHSTLTTNLGAPPPMIGDFNGDRRADVLNFAGADIEMDVFNFREEGKEHLLEKVKNGYNHVTEWHYKKLTDENGYHTRGILTEYPLNAVQPALYTVSDFKMQNGIGGTSTIQYTYEGTKLHRAGKGFLGFGKITADNLTTGIKTVIENEFNTTYFTAVPFRTSTYLTASNELLSHTTNTNEFVSPATKRFWIKTTSIFENNIFEGRILSTSNIYDNHGNITKSTVTNGVEVAVTTAAYGAFPAGVPNKPTSVTRSNTRAGQAVHTISTGYGYNALGQLVSRTDFAGLPKNVVTTYEYFPLGNLKKTTVSPANLPARTTSFVYDPKGRYPESATNELNQTATTTYDPKWGKPLTATGIDGLVTTTEYDAFGRPKKTTFPEGYFVSQSYGWDISGSSVWYEKTSHPGKPDVKIWHDLLGREIKTEQEGFQAQPVVQLTTYDARGNISTSTAPYKAGEPLLTTTTQYDAYNRPVTISNNGPFGTTTMGYSYVSGKLTTTITAPSGISSKVTDSSGQVIEATDNGGTLTYTYYSHGGLKEVNSGNSIITSSQYDVYGRQTSLTDANAGTTTYDYNALGQLATQTNANNKTHTMQYDLLGRNTTRIGPEGITTYEYYPTGSAASTNQLKKVTGFAGNLEEYTYDALGRLQTVKQTADATAYTTTYGYNLYSDVTSIMYPSGFGTNHAYDANGYPTTIKNSTNTITLYTNTGINGSGQNTAYTLGNGKTSAVSYNYGIPKQFTTPGVQNLELTWDYAKGNLSKRKDYIKNKEESFTYDNLNRLLSATVSGKPAQTIAYSPSGNISSKSDAGQIFAYHLVKINAITGVSLGTSAIPVLTQDITYTAFNQPQKITENGSGQPYELTYTYGADYQRLKGVMKKNNALINTHYYFGSYEKDVTPGIADKHLHYISSPAGLIAIVIRENNADQYYYTYTDHLGSLLTLTAFNGTVILDQNFDAWGRLRHPANWDYANVPAPTSYLYRGFTGHEHLTNFNLINMNGRMYDPVVGRVLSVDNYVQDPYSTQGYNRYSYVMNNPLKYTDPSGEFALSFAIGLIDGYFSQGSRRLDAAWQEAAHRVNMEARISMGLFKTDPNKKPWGRVWEVVSRFTWQNPQVLGGAASSHVANTILGKVKSVNYKYGATVVQTSGNWGGLTQGNYIIGDETIAADANNPLFQHEYGHYIQSQSMGLAYYPRIGIPSIFSKGDHDFHPAEQDANRRSFLYMNRHVKGFQNDLQETDIDPFNNRGWDFTRNPLNTDGTNTRGSILNYQNPDHRRSLDVIKVRAKWYDYAGWLIGGLGVGFLNSYNYNH